MNDSNNKDFDLNKYYELLGNFDLDIYLKHPKDYIQDEMSFDDYLDYREKLSSKIHNLFLKDFDSLKDLLELAGTMNYFIGCLANRIAHESFFTKKHQKHLERNLVHDGESMPVFETDSQLTDTLYKFMDIFEKKFVMLGVIYQYKANILDNIEIDESYFINEFDELDFSQIKAFFKLYQEGELD
jgi:hypothetical protein